MDLIVKGMFILQLHLHSSTHTHTHTDSNKQYSGGGGGMMRNNYNEIGQSSSDQIYIMHDSKPLALTLHTLSKRFTLYLLSASESPFVSPSSPSMMKYLLALSVCVFPLSSVKFISG